MGESAVSQSTANKKTIECVECGKSLASKQSLTNHVLKIHRKIEETYRSPLIKSTSSVLTAAPAPAPVPAPAPPSTPAPPSLPGPSTAAAVESTPSGTAAPALRNLSFSGMQEERTAEDEDDDGWMEEEEDEQFLHEALDKLAQEVSDPESDKDARHQLQIKITEITHKLQAKDKNQKFMIERLRKDAAGLRQSIEKQKKLEHEITELKAKKCDECENLTQVESYQRVTITEKENELVDAARKLTKTLKDHKQDKDQHKKVVDSLHDTVGSLTKRNNDLKVELAERVSYIESLETEVSPENDNVVDAEVEVHREQSVERVTMNKNSTEHICQACDKKFNAGGDLDRHMQDKHTESECPMCEKKFTSKKQANEHICLEGEIVPQICSKSYCKKQFTSSAALTSHTKKHHFGHQRNVCTKCGEILDISISMKDHIKTCGRSLGDNGSGREKSQEVCRHWRRGRCDRGTDCNFSHVGHQDTVRPERQRAASAIEACHNGPSCSYLARGKCKYDHKADRHQSRAPQGARHQGRAPHGARQEDRAPQSARAGGRQARSQQDGRSRCRYGANCDRVVNCPHLHSTQDFPMYNKNQGFRKTNSNNQNW